MAFDLITPKKLSVSAIPAATGTLYTVPASTRTFIKNIDIVNTNAFPVKVTLYLVPTGDSAAVANTLLSDTIIKPKSNFQWTGAQILNAGDTIQAVSDLTGSTIHISGGEAI